MTHGSQLPWKTDNRTWPSQLRSPPRLSYMHAGCLRRGLVTQLYCGLLLTRGRGGRCFVCCNRLQLPPNPCALDIVPLKLYLMYLTERAYAFRRHRRALPRQILPPIDWPEYGHAPRILAASPLPCSWSRVDMSAAADNLHIPFFPSQGANSESTTVSLLQPSGVIPDRDPNLLQLTGCYL